MKIIKLIWGTKSDLEREDFKEINSRLKIPFWSRKWEYPFAILNSKIKEASNILIAGCAGDYLVDYFLGTQRIVFGIDILPVNIEHKNFYFQQEDIRDLPFMDETISQAFCISTIEHIKDDPMKSINELYRVLIKGGQLILTFDINQSSNVAWKFKEEELKKLCKDLNVELPKIPEDVLKSEDYEDGKSWPGLRAMGLVISKEFQGDLNV